VNPAAVAEHAARLALPLLHAGVILTVDPRSTYAVAARLGDLELILLNLMRNAREAIGERGSIHIATDDLDVDGEQAARLRLGLAGPHVAISVADTGTADDLIDRIFEPSFTTKSAEAGTGVGLAAVSSTVGRYDGSIAVETAVGTGTRITVFLPAITVGTARSLPGLRLVRPSGADALYR
jgi:signal transduction histidine kinase